LKLRIVKKNSLVIADNDAAVKLALALALTARQIREIELI